MKFIKSNMVKRLIVLLVALMIFNIAIPKEVNAGLLQNALDTAGGILFKTISIPVLSTITSINIHLSVLLHRRGYWDSF